MNLSFLVKHYVYDRRYVILCIVLMLVVYVSVYFVYNVVFDALVYALFLMSSILVTFMIFDFHRYQKRHRDLNHWMSHVSYSDVCLSQSLCDIDYAHLIKELKELHFQTVSQHEQSYKDLEDYFTLWAHQMKLPIAAIKLLLETEDVPDTKLLKSELLKINQYSDMVLAYLRMRSLQTDYVFKNCSLDIMIRQGIRKFSSEFIRKKISIDFVETHITVLTDEKWLVFVLEQILSNALKYTEQGKISIYMENDDLVIEDTGIGIDEADLPRLFEKGYTGLNGRFDKKATGLGLYLSKQILDKLNHRIRIDSIVNQGTKVYLSLQREQIHMK